METEIVLADLADPRHQEAILSLMDAYSADPMGDGKPLSDSARRNLLVGLQQHPTTIIFLAFLAARPVGIATCFRGFSTFAARPLINISDFFVLPPWQGQGIGLQMLLAVEAHARSIDCCKLTLEVQEHNRRARRIYQSFGFDQVVYGEETGVSLYLTKPLATGPSP